MQRLAALASSVVDGSTIKAGFFFHKKNTNLTKQRSTAFAWNLVYLQEVIEMLSFYLKLLYIEIV